MKKFIAVFGSSPQSGKTTFAEYITGKMGVGKVHEMGYAVKKKGAKCIGLDYETADRLKDKGRVVVLDEHGDLVREVKVRHVMQECMSGEFEKHGIRIVMCAEANERIFATDEDTKIVAGFRCPANAYDLAQLHPEYEFIIVMVKREGYTNENCHPLEQMVNLLRPHYTIDAADINELHEQADDFLTHIA